MAKAKSGEMGSAPTQGTNNLTYKKEQRRKQSEHDREVAVSVEGWTERKAVTDDDRCNKCHHPSAVVRRGGNLCTRCLRKSDPAKARARQEERDSRKAPVPLLAEKLARPSTTSAAAL